MFSLIMRTVSILVQIPQNEHIRKFLKYASLCSKIFTVVHWNLVRQHSFTGDETSSALNTWSDFAEAVL